MLQCQTWQKEVGRVQDGGVKLGKKRMRTTAYDDVILLADDEEAMNRMLSELDKFLRKSIRIKYRENQKIIKKFTYLKKATTSGGWKEKRIVV